MISVDFKTFLKLKNKIGNLYYETLLVHQHDDYYIGFTPSCPPHILQQNWAHAEDLIIKSSEKYEYGQAQDWERKSICFL